MAFFSKLRGAVGLDARLFLGIVLSGAILMFVMKVVWSSPANYHVNNDSVDHRLYGCRSFISEDYI